MRQLAGPRVNPPSALSSGAGTSATAEMRDRDAFRGWFYGLTFSYPLLWVIGLGGLYWLLLAAGAVFCLRRAKLSGLVWVVLAVPAVLILSAPIGMVGNLAGSGRLVGLAANIAVWVSLAAVVHLVQTGDESRGLSRAFALLGLCQGAVTLLAAAVSPSVLPIPLLNGLAARMPGGLGAFMDNDTIYSASWLGDEAFRSAGMMGQPTWAGAIALLSLLASLYLLVRARERGVWRAVALAALPAAAFSVHLSLSRAVEMGLLIAVLAGLGVVVRRASLLAFLVLVSMTAAVVIIIVLTQGAALVEWLGTINGQREGSLYARSEIYSATWQLIASHPFPMLGYGVKPESGALAAPIATHSAYLGLVFRGGILGLMLLVAFYAAVLRRSISARCGWATAATVFIMIWSIFEDMDPGHLVPLGLALAVAWARSAQRSSSGRGTSTSALSRHHSTESATVKES